MPNVDDAGKLFESTPGNVTVPKPNLESEYAWNFEIGVVKNIGGKVRGEINGFHTILNNAIARRPYTLNGQDSIFSEELTAGLKLCRMYQKQQSGVYNLVLNVTSTHN